jgi:GNAT superfamily N-acetyltransferase
MNKPALVIREAVAEDVALIHALVRELAEYERERVSAQLTEAELLRDGFEPGVGEAPAFSCLVAEQDGVGCGFALYFPVYSTWAGRSLYLEDLFVRPEYRGRGIGKGLLTSVARIAAERGCARLDWSVLRWNEPAIGFYETLGAVRLDEWDRMRLAGPALAAVAARSEFKAAGVQDTTLAGCSLEHAAVSNRPRNAPMGTHQGLRP